MNQVWTPLPEWRRKLVSELLCGAAHTSTFLLDQLLEKPAPFLNGWIFQISGRDTDGPTKEAGSRVYSADFVGDAIDADGSPVQAVLVVSSESVPLELEIFRLDGGQIMRAPEALQFKMVREG
jgi:hypothetical protein